MYQKNAFQPSAFQTPGFDFWPPTPDPDDIVVWARNRQPSAIITDYNSIIVTERLIEHSEWTGMFPIAASAVLKAGYFITFPDSAECYLIERRTHVMENGAWQVEAWGRSATALLHTRTIEGTLSWTQRRRGRVISDIIESLTGDRAIEGLAFGQGDGLGLLVDMQRSWGDAGEVIREIAAAAHLGLRSRLLDGTVYIDVYAPVESDVRLGDTYGNAAALRIDDQMDEWRNYAYVLGEGEGDDREQVEVDLTSGEERRELYVDARDLAREVDSVETPLANYQEMLYQRGLDKLSETRRIESAEGQSVTAEVSVGDVCWYDDGTYADWLHVTEREFLLEGGLTDIRVTMGEPPPTLKKTIRRTR